MAYMSSNLLSPASAALQNKQNYSILSPQAQNYSIMQPKAPPAPMATSIATKQPVAGSMSPLTSIAQKPAPVAPKVATPQAPAMNQPGGMNSMGTHILTQPELDAQNAKNGVTQQNLNPAPVGTNVSAPINGNSSTTGNGDTSGNNSNTGTGQNQQVDFPGLVRNLINYAQTGSPQAQAAYQKAQDINTQLEQVKEQEKQGIANIDTAPHTVHFGQGTDQAITNQYIGRENALAGQLQAQQGLYGTAMTGQGQALTALGNAAGYAQPNLAGFNQQSFNPLTGAFGSGASANGSALSQLPSQAQTAINSYAQQVKNGTMTRQDAEGRLSAYGVAGTNALNEVLGPNFNTNASNASAGTTATGQQIQTAAQSTNQALDTLATAFNSLSGFQTGGIPATNSLLQWVGSQFGDQALQQFKTNLADARSQLIGVLNSAGGTPTGNEATAQQYLPDNMTKAMFDANVGTAQNPGIVRQLIAQKVNSFTTSGQQNSTPTQNGNSSLFSW